MAVLKVYKPCLLPASHLTRSLELTLATATERKAMPGEKKKKKLSKVSSLGSDVATSGHLSYENHHSKDTCSPTFTAAETQTWENVHRQIKETVVHIHTQWTLLHP